MRIILIVSFAAVSLWASGSGSQAQNTLSILQFGALNSSLATQSGIGNSTAVLQFGTGSAQQSAATVVQTGSVANPNSINNTVIGQGGSMTNNAGVSQIGASNFTFIGQIGTVTNSATVVQFGPLNTLQGEQIIP